MYDYDSIIQAAISDKRIAGFTHTFYRYPARFSPEFARAAILTFTVQGDLVLDPFMGGGTTLVEASALGRSSIGFDINQLASFISKVKTTVLDENAISIVSDWANEIKEYNLQSRRKKPEFWISQGYQRNLNSKDTWRIRNFIEIALESIKDINHRDASDFIRCVILNTGQWGLDGRKIIPSLDEFRKKLQINAYLMLEGIKKYASAMEIYEENCPPNTKVIHGSATKISKSNDLDFQQPKLVLMSPPYPGIHVLYHRWQVSGRRETPAPFWIANCYDGKGASYYTLGSREAKDHESYFKGMSQVFAALMSVSAENAHVVQLVGFSDPAKYLPRYLSLIRKSGLREVTIREKTKSRGYTRKVPNRKWYASSLDKSPGSKEYLLIHKVAKGNS